MTIIVFAPSWPRFEPLPVASGQRHHRSMLSVRRFPPPWMIEEHAVSFIVSDAPAKRSAIFTSTMSRSAARRPTG
jgi:hypothetical protein